MAWKTVRFYERGGKRAVQTGLTREEAQAIARDPESSSRTCTKPANKRRTRERGPWFVGFAEE